MTAALELLFRHRGTLLILAAAPIIAGCFELGFSWWDGSAGLALIAVGALVRLFAIRRIGKRARVTKSGAAHLVCEGPYAHTRNPLYLANLCTAAGAALLAGLRVGSLSVVVFVLLVYQLAVLAEEETLGDMFGEEFDLYCRRVPRWVPRLTAAERAVPAVEPVPAFSWSEVLLREGIYLLGVVALAGGTLYVHLRGPGMSELATELDATAVRFSVPRWSLVALFVVSVACAEGVRTSLKRRRHARRKEWWARAVAEAHARGERVN